MRRKRRATPDAPRLNQRRDGQETEQTEGGEKARKRRGGGGGGGGGGGRALRSGSGERPRPRGEGDEDLCASTSSTMRGMRDLIIIHIYVGIQGMVPTLLYAWLPSGLVTNPSPTYSTMHR